MELLCPPKKLLFYKGIQGFVPVFLDASIRVSISVNFFGDISESLHLISSAFLPSISFGICIKQTKCSVN